MILLLITIVNKTSFTIFSHSIIKVVCSNLIKFSINGEWPWSAQSGLGRQNSSKIQWVHCEIQDCIKVQCFNIFTEVDDDEGDQDSFYLMLPRVSYLPLVTDKVIRSMLDMFPNWLKAFVSLKVKKHFQRHVEKEDEVWFSFNDTPLKWHYPIGLLFDLLVTDDILPWVITVKFSKYPEEVLFKCPNK